MTLQVQERSSRPPSVFFLFPSSQSSCLVWNQWWEFKFIHQRARGEAGDRRARRWAVCAWKRKENPGRTSSAETVEHSDHSGGNFTISLVYHVWESAGANLEDGLRQWRQIRQLKYVEDNPFSFFLFMLQSLIEVVAFLIPFVYFFFLQEILKSKIGITSW